MKPKLLTTNDSAFPAPSQALIDPDGLLAIGGDLSPQRLLTAYQSGIFPWYSEGEPILWWSPSHRALLFPDEIKISRSLTKRLNNIAWQVRFDTQFQQVVSACAGPRKTEDGTWITTEMQDAYYQLHKLGYAHSVEVFLDKQLVGGLYGISLGGAFFGESMFSRVSDASKVALVSLCQQLAEWQFDFIDCQMMNSHLETLGVTEIPRDEFLLRLGESLQRANRVGAWRI